MATERRYSDSANFIDYESVFQGKSGYMTDLADLKEENGQDITDFDKIVTVVYDKVHEIVEKIKAQEEITELMVGKSHARERENTKFDPSKPVTWKLSDGISGRWRNRYKPEGYRVLIVVACLTNANIVPVVKRINDKLGNPQMLAVALELNLIGKLLYKDQLPIQNESFRPGSHAADDPKAGLVYLAIKLGLSSNAPKESKKSEKVQMKLLLHHLVYHVFPHLLHNLKLLQHLLHHLLHHLL